MTQTAENSSFLVKKNDAKTINAWCSYDWANSVYNLTITAAIFPIYYSSATRKAFGSDTVIFLGIPIENSVLYSYAISFSFLVIVLLLPILSGIADYSGKKKRFMQAFTYTGSLACFGLFFFTGANLEWGIFCAVLASIGYAGALVFYNAFLPEIATTDKMDSYSARGFSMGYIGSVILLLINIYIIFNIDQFGISSVESAQKLAFLMVAFWWFGFSHIAFFYLKDKPTGNKLNTKVISKGFQEIKTVIQKLNKQVNTQRFLFAFFFYSMGVQTVMLLAPLFGEKEIKMDTENLVIVVLILQIVAIIGAYVFAALSRKFGNKVGLAIAVIIWIGVCIGGYFLQQESEFYMLAVMLGFVMGGIQSLSRSTYAKLIPENSPDTASYFSFYDISEKVAIVLGTFSYGFIEQLTGSMRNSLLAMTIFFLTGFAFLMLARLPKTTS